MILTSGTTGTPKGAPRNEAGIDAAVSLLSRMPLKAGWTPTSPRRCSTPGATRTSRLACCSARRRPHAASSTPRACLETVAEKTCDSLVVIPVMLQRILQLPDETLDEHDLSTIKAVAASGSAMPGDLATTWMDRFGDTLYNVYGSTEVAYASVATPAGPARGARHGRQAAARDRRTHRGRAGRAGPDGGVRPDLRRQRAAVRGLHRRRPQGDARRADVER